MVNISLPDGSVRSFDKPVSGAEIAASIGPGLAKAALALKVDGKMVDLSHVVSRDAKIGIVTARDPDALECIVGAPSKVSADMAQCRDEVRWFPAMVSNHVMDLIERYGWNSDIPSELTDYVKARKFYDYKDHSRVGAAHGEFATDEICERFAVIGDAEQCAKKLRDLEAVGVNQFNLYLMTDGQEEVLDVYGRDIIPKFANT